MTRDAALAILRDHAAELQAAGIQSLSIFGSLARNEAITQDIDLAIQLFPNSYTSGLDYIWRREELRAKLQAWLGMPVDLVEEPAAKQRLQAAIDRDRQLAF